LTKELRLANLTTLEQANAFLPGFIERYNARFAKAAQDPEPAWVPLPADLDLAYYFAIREPRKVGRDHCIRFAGRCWQLLPDPQDPSLVEQSVNVHRVPEGEIYLYHGKRRIAYQAFVAPQVALSQPPSAVAPPGAPVVRKSTARQRAWLFGHS
jgi:hypothetical protein